MVSNLVLGSIAVLSLWLLVLTILFWRIQRFHNKLIRGNGENLKTILEGLLKEISFSRRELDSLSQFVNKLHKQSFFHIQKVGLVRFNPFKDTGGDQSFVLSLIDGNDTGVIISGLYSRSGTRWYAKKVVKGKPVEHELSEEEKKALEEAKAVE